jgi:hypothetical protein
MNGPIVHFESNWLWLARRLPFVVMLMAILLTIAVVTRRFSFSITGTFRTSDLVVDNNASVGSDATFGGRATFLGASASTDGIVEVRGSSPGTTKQLFVKEIDTNHTASEANNAVLFQQATFDTSAGLANAVGLDVEVSSTRVAGSNDLSNIAILALAGGGDNNLSFYSPPGGGKMTVTDGAAIGPTVLTATLEVDGTSHLEGDITTDGNMRIGINPGTPHALTVNAAPTFNQNSDFEANATFNGTALFDNPVRIGTASSNRHVIVPTTAVAPTFSGCGSAPLIDGGDFVATVHTDTDSSTTCTIVFHSTYGAAPHCTVTSRDGLQVTYATTATQLAVTNAGLANTTFDYTCVGPT